MNLTEAAKAYNRARIVVLGWVQEQSILGNLVRNGDAPGWAEYERSRSELFSEIEKVGT